ncbi:CAP domain-containing protein [Streptomyces sp. NPDC001514]
MDTGSEEIPMLDEDGDEWDAQWDGGSGTGLRFLGRAGGGSSRARPFVRTRQHALEDLVVSLVNQERSDRGLARLRAEELLRISSRSHSRDMATRGFFDHVTPEGGTPAERMTAAGYPFPAAENVAICPPDAWVVVRAWMNSPGHRVNILRPRVRSVGVGVFLAPGTGLAWWTQNFGYL